MLAGGLAFVAANGDGLHIYDSFAPSAPAAPVAARVVGRALGVSVWAASAFVADFPATLSVVGW